MSAICGIISFEDQGLLNPATQKMMDALNRHGPDGGHVWKQADTAFGHQMMHVTPQSLNENLPFYHTQSQVAVTADARLDNRDELISALDLIGTDQLADSELILRAYLRWGTDCAQHFIGEFAIAIHDGIKQRLVLVTDPMGIRPLYYCEKPASYFAFSSEVPALVSLDPAWAPVNLRRIAMLGVSMLSTYIEPESTCFKNIYRLPAATVFVLEGKERRRYAYWQPDARKRIDFKSDEECREAFNEVFFTVLKAHLRSAFPVASMLSGGLDSSAIVSVAHKLLRQKNDRLLTLSNAPMDDVLGTVADELEYVDQFRGYEGLDMHYVHCPSSGPFDRLDQLVESGELCSYSYQHFLYSALIETAAQNNARVILDGDGGELSCSAHLSGYLAELAITGNWKRLGRELKHLKSGKSGFLTTLKSQAIRPLIPDPVLIRLGFDNDVANHLKYPIRADFVHDVLGQDIDDIETQIAQMFSVYPDHRKNMCRSIVFEQNDIRQRSHAGFPGYQKATITYPFLDKRLIEFGIAVDGRFKYQDGEDRRLIRLAMRGLMPEKIRTRVSKTPFSPDYSIRYDRSRTSAATRLKSFSESPELGVVIDFEKVMGVAEKSASYNPTRPMLPDPGSQFTVPSAMYLCYFLARWQAISH